MINDEYAGPRLQAAIRASQSFRRRVSGCPTRRANADFLPTYEAETAAIRRRDPEAAGRRAASAR